VFDPHRFVPTRKGPNRYALVELEDINPNLKEQYPIIQEEVKQKRYISSLIMVDLLLKNEPDLGPALLIKAKILSALHRYQESASILYQYLSLRSEDVSPVQLAISNFHNLGDHEKVSYYSKMLELNRKAEVHIDRSRSIFGGSTSVRTTSNVNSPKRQTRRKTERYELPRVVWNSLMHAYTMLIRDDISPMTNFMIQMLIDLEPKYAEGRMVEASILMKQGNLRRAESVIRHVLDFDSQYNPAKDKLKELEQLRNDVNTRVTLPVMEHKSFLDDKYYLNLQKFDIKKENLPASYSGENGELQPKFCNQCGNRRKSMDHKFCTGCGKKY
jgi:tetratricopeptide (TPR) repeat protein